MTTVRDNNNLDEYVQSTCNLEGITLIWYDEKLNVNTRQQLKITKKHLREINNCVQLYKDEQECIKSIKSIKNEKIILITSGCSADSILSSDDKLVYKSVHAIFIFCADKDKYRPLLGKYSKMVGIFTDQDELKASIKQEINLIERYFETFNFYNKNEQKSTCNLSKESAKFIWLSIFKDILVKMPKDENAKRQMIEICTKYYLGNKNETNLIQEFERTYKAELAIRWYTRPSFVYKMVNKALRTEDVEQLYTFRFYISDLSEEIAKRQKENNDQQSLILYRGVRLPIEEVKILQESQGNLISTNGFFSTSISKEVAMGFSTLKTEMNSEESVLFEIMCDHSSAAFAIIGEESVHPEEKEVLFDLDATFEVLSVTKSEEVDAKIPIWIVRVRSTQDGTSLAKVYIEDNRQFLEQNPDIEVFWGSLLAQMGQTDKAYRYLQKLIDTRPSNLSSQISLEMGRVLNLKGKFDEALKHLEFFEKQKKQKCSVTPAAFRLIGDIYKSKGQYDLALNNHVVGLTNGISLWGENNSNIAQSYMQIGQIFLLKGDWKNAEKNFQKVEEIGKKLHPDDHRILAQYYLIVGISYAEKEEMRCAMEYYQKAADIFEKVLPLGHAGVFYQMGCALHALGDNVQSLEYHNRALKIAEKECADRSDTTAASLTAIGQIYRSKGEFKESLDYFEKALQMRLASLGQTHADVALSYYTKGGTLEYLERNDEALTVYETALAIQKQLFPNGHQHTALTLSSIGNQYRRKEMFELAMQYCDEAFQIQKKAFPQGHLQISLTLFHKALILNDRKQYDQSLKHLSEALAIQNKYGREGSLFYASILTAIGNIHKQISELDLAIQYYKLALSTKQKLLIEQDPQILELISFIEELEQSKG